MYGVAAVESGHTSSLAEGTGLTHFRALAAIVEPSPYTTVSLDDGEMEKYLRVLEEAYSHSTVLPAPPGTVFQSQSTLTRWLELHYFTLTEALSVIEGHAAAAGTASVTIHPRTSAYRPFPPMTSATVIPVPSAHPAIWLLARNNRSWIPCSAADKTRSG